MLPILAIGLVILGLFLAIVLPLARTRLQHRWAAAMVVLLLGCDFAGNYIFISNNKGKLGEPSYRTLFPDINQLGLHNAYRSARYLVVGILPDRLAGTATDYPALPEPGRIARPEASIVVIMNESIRADSLSLLGHEVATTPRLAKVEGLYAAPVFAAGTMTRTSFAGLVNRLKYPGIGAQFVSQSNCLFRLAHQNGFETHFIYSQSRQSIDTLLPFMCPKDIDVIRADGDAAPDQREFDDSLLYHLKAIDLDRPNFILIGPDGAHTPYGEKSPESFKIFDDDYDNAILYSDHVMAEIIDHLSRNSRIPTYVIITSDHGELLKGEDELRGHGWFKREVVLVPFLFLALNTAESAAISAEVAKVQSHFDIASLVIRLMGYDATVEPAEDKEIFVNGSDLSGLAGYLRLHFLDEGLKSVEVMNGMEANPGVAEFDPEG
jgi:glucan phosphoethanolaminetransferase (alkaline phosphatase superfamily)